MSELPPNERPPQEPDENTHALLWTVVGIIVVIGIAGGAIAGFMGGRIFNGLRTVTDAEVVRLFGALPTDEGDRVALPAVEPGGPAWQAGLADGDVLLRLDDTQITSAAQAKRHIAGYAVGERVLVTYERSFRPGQTEVIIGVSAPPPATATPRPAPTVITPPQSGQQRENAKLGLVYRPIGEQDGDRFGVEHGAIVLVTTPNGPADFAGMEPGDIIVGVGNVTLSEDMSLQRALAGFNAGQEVKVRVLRGGEEQLLDVTLGR
jgi:S1-C subfamily serine protease